MFPPSQNKKLRERAIQAMEAKAKAETLVKLDCFIDTLAREVLELPPRPEGQLPYVGWLTTGKESVSGQRQTSQVGINLIKKYEGLRTNAYLCPANVWTIGYGHTKGVSRGMMISHLEAEELLQEDLRVYEKAVNESVKVDLTQNQFDALVSFTYNVGVGAFSNSTLLRLLNRSKVKEVANQFSRWTRTGGQVLPGLVNRRKDEYSLFIK